MLVETKNNWASKEYTKRENNLFETVEPQKNQTTIGEQLKVVNLQTTQEMRLKQSYS